MQRVAMPQVLQGAPMVVHDGDAEVQLHIGSRQCRVGLEKPAGLRHIGAEHAAPLPVVAAHRMHEPQYALRRSANQVEIPPPVD
ncbi:MAG: hypothetical protein B7X10_01965 [Burkholderiales bacterium 21-58-4]|nr:MAG: hypothetical protein B7X10_01965 [Burkholderiales bacterium 21-58-4]